MIDYVNAIKDMLTSNIVVNHAFVGDYNDFVAEEYPAICIQPGEDNSILDEGLNWGYDNNCSLIVWYVDSAPENRDKTSYIQKIDQIKSILQDNPTLNGSFNLGMNIGIEYTRRQLEDNIEFVTKIQIDGRNV